jgi:hypothetical protein
VKRSTSDLNNSVNLPRFNCGGLAEGLLVTATLAGIIFVAAWWVFSHGYVLYYGDAQSHLNLSRSIIDSRTPGYDQLGTVWLPVLHVICLPFVGNINLWSNGLAGTIPVATCFVVAGMALFYAARETYRSQTAAWIVVLCLAANPNLLYLGTIPMTEVVFLAGLGVLLLALVRFEATQQRRWLLLGVLASWWMSLTRYDGWFLIPFAAVWFAWSAGEERWNKLLVFGFLASLAPLYWIAHNWWETSNALNFYNGPYSAIAIQGDKPYPGYRDWPVAATYYLKAGQLCAGWNLLLLGVAGLIGAFTIRAYRPVLFLLLTPAFYIWSIHSSKSPIFLPQLPPHGYYNSRYGIAVVVFGAFACGAIFMALPARWSRYAFVVPLLAVLPWLLRPSKQNWICWKESQVNSDSRRAWTKASANYLQDHYIEGQGILTPSASGDLAGIFCRARIPLKETINVGNGPEWMANTARPDLIHQQLWAVEQQDDDLYRDLSKERSPYAPANEITVKGAATVVILRRGGT